LIPLGGGKVPHDFSSFEFGKFYFMAQNMVYLGTYFVRTWKECVFVSFYPIDILVFFSSSVSLLIAFFSLLVPSVVERDI
jgi:hypothetical protein